MHKFAEWLIRDGIPGGGVMLFMLTALFAGGTAFLWAFGWFVYCAYTYIPWAPEILFQ